MADKLCTFRNVNDIKLFYHYTAIHDRILQLAQEEARYFGTSFEYNVPETYLEVPGYNLKECLYFLINRFREEGFDVLFRKPNVIILNWSDPEHDKKMKEIEEFLENEHLKSAVFDKFSDSQKDDHLIEYKRIPAITYRRNNRR